MPTIAGKMWAELSSACPDLCILRGCFNEGTNDTGARLGHVPLPRERQGGTGENVLILKTPRPTLNQTPCLYVGEGGPLLTALRTSFRIQGEGLEGGLDLGSSSRELLIRDDSSR